MTKPIPSETIEYERYVDGLRRENALLRETAELARYTIANLCKPDYSGSIAELRAWGECLFLPQANALLAGANTALQAKTITVHIEGGLVQDVSGIPAGTEVHVHDHDDGDTSHPSWDAEKECFVTVYDGSPA